VLSDLLESDISEVRNEIRNRLNALELTKKVSKSVSKSIAIIDFLTSEKSRAEILHHLGLINHTKNFNSYIKPLLDYKIIELTIPDKPQSQFQKYRLTSKGKKLLKSHNS